LSFDRVHAEVQIPNTLPGNPLGIITIAVRLAANPVRHLARVRQVLEQSLKLAPRSGLEVPGPNRTWRPKQNVAFRHGVAVIYTASRCAREIRARAFCQVGTRTHLLSRARESEVGTELVKDPKENVGKTARSARQLSTNIKGEIT